MDEYINCEKHPYEKYPLPHGRCNLCEIERQQKCIEELEKERKAAEDLIERSQDKGFHIYTNEQLAAAVEIVETRYKDHTAIRQSIWRFSDWCRYRNIEYR